MLLDFQLPPCAAEDAIRLSVERFGPARIALASSFGAEDQQHWLCAVHASRAAG